MDISNNKFAIYSGVTFAWVEIDIGRGIYYYVHESILFLSGPLDMGWGVLSISFHHPPQYFWCVL